MTTHQLAQSINFAFSQCQDDETHVLLQAVLDGMIKRQNRVHYGEGAGADIAAVSDLLIVAMGQIKQVAMSADADGAELAFEELSEARHLVETVLKLINPYC